MNVFLYYCSCTLYITVVLLVLLFLFLLFANSRKKSRGVKPVLESKRVFKTIILCIILYLIVTCFNDIMLDLMPKVENDDIVGIWSNGDETLLLKEYGLYEYHGADENLISLSGEPDECKWAVDDWNLYLAAKKAGDNSLFFTDGSMAFDESSALSKKGQSPLYFGKCNYINQEECYYYCWRVIKYNNEFRIIDNYPGIDSFCTNDLRFRK